MHQSDTTKRLIKRRRHVYKKMQLPTNASDLRKRRSKKNTTRRKNGLLKEKSSKGSFFNVVLPITLVLMVCLAVFYGESLISLWTDHIDDPLDSSNPLPNEAKKAYRIWIGKLKKATNKRAITFRESLQISYAGKYVKSDNTEVTLTEPRFPIYTKFTLTSEELGKVKAYTARFTHTQVSVINMDSLELPYVLRSLNKKTAVLNFADAFDAGGLVFSGVTTQEEELCRRSNFYCSIGMAEHKGLYPLQKNSFYDLSYKESWVAGIYSPNVQVFKDVNYSLLDMPFMVDIITVAFLYLPQNDTISKSDLVKEKTLHRARLILRMAAENDVDVLVLGAIGCGVFHNKLEIVSDIFMKLIKDEFWGVFEQVYFSVIIGGYAEFNDARNTVFGPMATAAPVLHDAKSDIGKEIARYILKSTSDTYGFVPILAGRRTWEMFICEELAAYKDLVDNADYLTNCVIPSPDDPNLKSKLAVCRASLQKALDP